MTPKTATESKKRQKKEKTGTQTKRRSSAATSTLPLPSPCPSPTEQTTEPKNAAFLWKYKRGDNPTPATHTSLIRGSYVVPLEKRKPFLAEYYGEFSKFLQGPGAQPSLFLTERYNTEYFPFFIDVDYAWDDQTPDVPSTITQIRKAVTRMLEYLRGAMDEGDVAVRDLEVRPSGRTAFKRHFVFPQVIVAPTNCLLFAKAVEKMLHVHSDLDIKFDMNVYMRGSLRMLGSCKHTGLVSSHPKETEFFYMPVDPFTGERVNAITYEEFVRHSILLDKETHDRVEKFMESGDGDVYLPRDEFGEDLYVTCKYIPSGVESTASGGGQAVYTPYTGSGRVSPDSELYKCILENYGDVIATASTKSPIVHDPQKNCSYITLASTNYCPYYGEHGLQHPYITLSEYGMNLKCHSKKRDVCIKGCKMIRRDDLPPAVVAELPEIKEKETVSSKYNIQANADLTTIRGRAELLQTEFIEDDLLPNDDEHNLLLLSLSGTHRDVANFVKPLMREYACVDEDVQRWYHYRKPLWRFKEAKNDMKVLLSRLPSAYLRLIQVYYRDFHGKEKARTDRISKILHVNDKLSDHAFKDKVARELASMCLDVRFELTLDTNQKLIGFNDGIFNLSTFEFEEGTPGHRVSMTVGYDFPRESNPIYRAELDQIMEDSQPEKDNREYLQTFLGSCLEGGNPDELFHIFAGTGRNGKSVLADLISVTLGSEGYEKEGGELSKYPYVYPFEPAFLTCDRTKSSTPAPEIIGARLSRVLIGSEPEAGQRINSAFIKKISGNDPLSGRLLFSNEILAYRPKFKLILNCNGIPGMDQNDLAVWKRARIVDFPTTFVDNPEKPNERKIDRKLKEKILSNMNYRKEFMLMLIHWYKTLYLVKGLHNPPESVLKATQAYQDESMPVAEYWRECITTVEPSAHRHLCVDCVYDDFCLRHSSKAKNYTIEKLRADLSSIGVIIVKVQSRCSNCPNRRHAIKNCQFSDERKKEKEGFVAMSTDDGF